MTNHAEISVSRSRGSARTKAATARDSREICVVGDDKRANKVAQRLKTLNIAIRRFGEELPPADAIGPDTAALVLVQPLDKRNMTQAIGDLCDAPRSMEIPIFVAAFDRVPDTEVRRFYDAGATAVFHWSQEAIIFPRLVAEVVGIDEVRGKTSDPDEVRDALSGK